jgi:hypothetical protein
LDRDSIIAVAEDLEYLASWSGDITDPEIRRGTAVLRRLLVEDAYGAAWRAVGKTRQPTLIAIDMDLMVGGHANRMEIALAGGADFRGVKTAAMALHKSSAPIGATPPPPIRPDGYPFERLFSLSEYLRSTSGIVGGKSFNRREVIKYIANIKGGVHLSAQARKKEAKLVERLGKAEKRFLIHTSDGLLVEAVAIGQSLGNSEDAKEFIRVARDA